MIQRATWTMFLTSRAARVANGLANSRFQRDNWAEALMSESRERTKPTLPHMSRRRELPNFSGSSTSQGDPPSSSRRPGTGHGCPGFPHVEWRREPLASRRRALRAVSTRQPVGSVDPAARHFTRRKKPWKARGAVEIRPHSPHHIVRAWARPESILPSYRCHTGDTSRKS